jgi:hypothetical protein
MAQAIIRRKPTKEIMLLLLLLLLWIAGGTYEDVVGSFHQQPKPGSRSCHTTMDPSIRGLNKVVEVEMRNIGR